MYSQRWPKYFAASCAVLKNVTFKQSYKIWKIIGTFYLIWSHWFGNSVTQIGHWLHSTDKDPGSNIVIINYIKHFFTVNWKEKLKIWNLEALKFGFYVYFNTLIQPWQPTTRVNNAPSPQPTASWNINRDANPPSIHGNSRASQPSSPWQFAHHCLYRAINCSKFVKTKFHCHVVVDISAQKVITLRLTASTQLLH